MTRGFAGMALAITALVLFGQGCFGGQRDRATDYLGTPPTATPPFDTIPDAVGETQVQEVLGIRFPQTGPAVFHESGLPEQDGALFYGASYRIAWSASEPDRLMGRIRILNITSSEQERDRVLADAVREIVGCDDSRSSGLSCDSSEPATIVLPELLVREYPIRFDPEDRDDLDVSIRSAVWILPIPGDSRAWMAIYPTRLDDVTSVAALSVWVRGLREE